MTDRFNALTVVLDHDIRDDDAEHILNAIRMVKGVLSVEGNVVNTDDFIHSARIRAEIAEKIREILYPRGLG